MSNSADRKTVLLIDKEENYCYLLAKVLRRAGADVVATTDTEKALDSLQNGEDYNLLVCDASLQCNEWEKLHEVLQEHTPEKLVFLGEELGLCGKQSKIAGQIPWAIVKRSLALDKLKNLVSSEVTRSGQRHDRLPTAPQASDISTGC